jgi:hypothetical protein
LVFGFTAIAPQLHAITTIRVSANAGASWTTLRDSAANPDGVVNFDGAIGASGWSVVASGNSALGSLTEPGLNVSSPFSPNNLSVNSSGAGTLLIEFSQTGYGAFPVDNTWTTSLLSHNLGDGVTTLFAYAGLGNTLFQKSTLLGAVSQDGLTDDASSAVTRVGIPDYQAGQLYSLTVRVSIYHSGAGSSTFDALLHDDPQAVPDGGITVALLGFAFLLLAGVAWYVKPVRKA